MDSLSSGYGAADLPNTIDVPDTGCKKKKKNEKNCKFNSLHLKINKDGHIPVMGSANDTATEYSHMPTPGVSAIDSNCNFVFNFIFNL